jgi:shikimate dehydrogenase
MPDRYAVIGSPITHSKSPTIHARFAQQTAQDMTYIALAADEDGFEGTVERFRSEGGRGMNVTLPFKHRAFALANRRSARAEHAVAANTLDFRDGVICADNTDGCGLVRDLLANHACELRGSRVLLMGAGGAAYGVCGPLLDEGPAELVIANRTPEKAVAMCRHFAKLHRSGSRLSAVSFDDLRGRAFGIVVNATSAGLSGEMPSLPLELFAPDALAYEMVYGRSTPFLEFARARGARTADGLGMLVEQAAESFFIWRGVRPETAPVIAELRAISKA